MILYFWVHYKLANSSLSRHSIMTKLSFGIVILYYCFFIVFAYFPKTTLLYTTKFNLYPDYYKDTKFLIKNNIYYLELSGIGINLFNQIIMLNFYFNVIKAIIIRENTVKFIKGNLY